MAHPALAAWRLGPIVVCAAIIALVMRAAGEATTTIPGVEFPVPFNYFFPPLVAMLVANLLDDRWQAVGDLGTRSPTVAHALRSGLAVGTAYAICLGAGVATPAPADAPLFGAACMFMALVLALTPLLGAWVWVPVVPVTHLWLTLGPQFVVLPRVAVLVGVLCGLVLNLAMTNRRINGRWSLSKG